MSDSFGEKRSVWENAPHHIRPVSEWHVVLPVPRSQLNVAITTSVWFTRKSCDTLKTGWNWEATILGVIEHRRIVMATRTLKDEAREGLLESIPFRKTVKQLRSFFATRRAVLAGEAVYDLGDEQRAAAGFMPARDFNLVQSGISGACAYVVTLFCNYVFGIKIPPIFNARDFAEDMVARLGVLVDKQDAAATSLVGWIDKSMGVIEVLVVPLTLYSTVAIIAYAALRPADRTPQNAVRIGHAYLYADGAYGLYSQTLGAFCFTSWLALGFVDSREAALAFFGAVLYLGYLVAWLWQGYVTLRIVPAKLFAIQGYSPNVESIDAIQSEGPWARYRTRVMVVVPLMAAVLKGVGIVLALLAGCLLALPELYRLKR